MKTITRVLSMLVILPLRFYIVWYILTSINATELPMFLFWASVPIVLLIATFNLIIDNENK